LVRGTRVSIGTPGAERGNSSNNHQKNDPSIARPPPLTTKKKKKKTQTKKNQSQQLEFFAEEERVTIVPNFSADAYECVSGTHGPFRPNVPCAVPLWLALYLSRRAKCRLAPPPWLSPSRLERTIRAEQEDGSTFQPVPFYYMEVACLLFEHARECFGSDFARVRALLARLSNIRRHKIEDGLRQVQAAVTVRLNHLSACEANLIRPSFQGALGAFDRLERQEAAWAEAAQAAAAAGGGGGFSQG
jgi:GINS complex subunit 2